MSVQNKPKIEAYIGASGSGKGVSINQRLDELQPSRLLIWDPRDEYKKRAPKYTTLPELVGAFVYAKGGPVRARFVPGGSTKLEPQFERLCKLAFAGGNMVFLAEELSDVTTASRAPAAWRQVITQGRHKGLHVLGASQRPALIDKNFLGACTYIRCFTLRYFEDRRAMAKSMDVAQEHIDALQTTETASKVTINFWEKDFREGISQAGKLELRRRAT